MCGPRAHALEASDDCDVAYTDASCCLQARDVAALGICEQLHDADGRKPSDTTRSRALFVPAPELSRVVAWPTTDTSDGTRHVRPSVFPGTTAHRIVAPGAMPSSHSTFASNLPSPTGVKR